MKISKIFAGMSALALAASMSIVASAEVVKGDSAPEWFTVEKGAGSVDLAKCGVLPDDVKVVKFTFTIDDSDGFGGGVMLNSSANEWDQRDPDWYWGNPDAEDADKRGLAAEGSDGNYTLTFTVPDNYGFGEPEEEGYWAQVALQQWWGADMTVTNVEINPGEAPAADPEPESQDEAPSQDETPSQAPAPDTTPAPSGDGAGNGNGGDAAEAGAAAGIALAGLAVAGAALVATKRK